MRSYFLCIITASVISAVCSSLASGTSMEKYVKYICSLICVAAVLLPIVPAIKSIDIDEKKAEYSVHTESQTMFTIDKAENSVEEYIKNIIFQKFGITPSSVSIEIYSEGDNVIIGDITVTIEKENEEFASSISDFLLTSLGAKGKVITAGG